MKCAFIVLAVACFCLSQAMAYGHRYGDVYENDRYGHGREYGRSDYRTYGNEMKYDNKPYKKPMNKYDRHPDVRQDYGHHESSYGNKEYNSYDKEEPKYEIGSYEPYPAKDQKYEREYNWQDARYDNSYDNYHEDKPRYMKERMYEPEYHHEYKDYSYNKEPKYENERAYEQEYHHDGKRYESYRKEPKYKKEKMYEHKSYRKNDNKPEYNKKERPMKYREQQIKYDKPNMGKNVDYNKHASYGGYSNYPEMHDVEYLRAAEKEAKKQMNKLRDDIWSSLVYDKKEAKNDGYNYRPQIEYNQPTDYKVLGY